MLWNINPFVHCEDVLLIVSKKADWPIARQDLGGRENAGKKKGRVIRSCQSDQRKQERNTGRVKVIKP